MLVLTRRVDESLVIRDDIVVTVLSVEGDKVKLGIQAPPEVRILRQELCEAVRQQNLAAARLGTDASAQVLTVVRQVLEPPPAPQPPQAKPED